MTETTAGVALEYIFDAFARLVQDAGQWSSMSSCGQLPATVRLGLHPLGEVFVQSVPSGRPILEFRYKSLGRQGNLKAVGSQKDGSKARSDVFSRVRNEMISKFGIRGVHKLSKELTEMDESKDKMLSVEELNYGLQDFGIDLSQDELASIVERSSASQCNERDNAAGKGIRFDDFMHALRGDLSVEREELVRAVFDKIDTGGNGIIDVDELAEVYDATSHPDVVSGVISPATALQQFMAGFDEDADGIEWEEFYYYFANVSW